ncbi:hypothetical protein CR513_21141, partial [Mucuna pruriens]
MKRHGIRDQCENWEALKHVMKARFVPPTYTKDLHNKLQSIEDYHKEMEMDLMNTQIRESEEDTMAQFLHGLYREI